MNAVRQTRCAALVSITSLALIVDGITRINLYSAAAGMTPDGSHTVYPPAAELAASVGLAFYGLFGLANGLYTLVMCKGHAAATWTQLACEFPLGWFFFSVFVLSSYPFMVTRAAAPMPGFTSEQSKAVIMMVCLLDACPDRDRLP